MAQIDDGLATNTAALIAGPASATTEVHVPSGVTALSPSGQGVYVDPQGSTTAAGASINKSIQGLAGTIQFSVPA